MQQNTFQNSGLNAFQIPKNIYNALQNAAQKTGVNFTYLMEKAAAESSFDPNAKASSSSATGLFQFIESTWMSMVRDYGDKYGLSNYASQIDDNGRVSSAQTRREILNLRKDPEISSLMAGEFARQNYDSLKNTVGGDIGSTELYLAHFMGASGAAGFLNAMKQSPNMIAADIFPTEARANRNVFFDSSTGSPRSLRQIYAMFDKKFDGNTGTQSQTLLASDTAASTRNFSAQKTYQTSEDPLARLASLLGTQQNNQSLLRITQDPMEAQAVAAQSWAKQDAVEATHGLWQAFPSSLYGNLALSDAQMMLLNDFSA